MQDFPELKPKTFLCVAAHPDDIEFGASGTVAKLVAEGAKGYYFILTNANKGSEDRNITSDQLRDMRREEQRNAGKILGLEEVFFGDYDDGGLEVTLGLKKDIVRVIRTVKPDLVMTMDPTMVYSAERGIVNHPDHRAAGQATLDSVYPLARDHLTFPDLLTDEGLEPHKVKTVLMNSFDKANFYVDISEHIDTKIKALAAHESQVGQNQLDMVRTWAGMAGEQAGLQYAEGFTRLDLAF